MKNIAKIAICVGLSVFAVLVAYFLFKYQNENGRTKITLASLEDQIAYFGHGMLFDINFNSFEPNQITVDKLQTAVIDVFEQHQFRDIGKDAIGAIAVLKALLEQKDVSNDERIIIRDALIFRMRNHTNHKIAKRYSWRIRSLAASYMVRNKDSFTDLRDEITGPLRDTEYLVDIINDARDTDYMKLCRLFDVPIPPDWNESTTESVDNWKNAGTRWVDIGEIDAENIILRGPPGEKARIYTYSDPVKRGACVALMRGGGAASQAGFICQSATTGAACFWDNLLRNGSAIPLGWKDKTLVINTLQDGTNLASVCTNCHQGNNVFLIAPDDPAWGKVLRSSAPENFTTRVEQS